MSPAYRPVHRFARLSAHRLGHGLARLSGVDPGAGDREAGRRGDEETGRQKNKEARGICAAPGGFSCGSERPFPDKVLCPARFFMKAAPFRVRATLPASRPVPLRTSPGPFSGPGSSPGIGRCLRNQKTAPAQFCAGAVKTDQLKKSPSFLSRSYLALAFASALLNSSFARSGNACARRAYRASPMMKS